MGEHRIPDSVLERIQGLSIGDVVGEDVTLKRAGTNLKGLCPFHDDRTPSFMVSPAKNICKCFACGEGGNVISYYMKKNGLSFVEAVRALGKSHGIDVPEVEMTDEQRAAQQRVESARVAITAAYGLYREALQHQPEAMKYLADRGITMETAETFGLGASLEYGGLTKALLAQGYSEDALVDAGVSQRREPAGETGGHQPAGGGCGVGGKAGAEGRDGKAGTGGLGGKAVAAGLGGKAGAEGRDGKAGTEGRGELRDVFWRRLLFPFMDRRGQVVGFTGRLMGATDRKDVPKYKNTGETCLFTKGRHIYGLYQALKAIQKENTAYIVEGQFDVLQMHQAGICNVVAGSGTAWTPEQRKLLHNLTANAVFIYDGDAAGEHAALRNLPDMVGGGFNVKCVQLPEGKDPDNMARKMGDRFRPWLENHTVGYVDFLCERLLGEEQDEHERLEAVKQVVAVVAREPEEVVRRQLLGKVAAAANGRIPRGETRGTAATKTGAAGEGTGATGARAEGGTVEAYHLEGLEEMAREARLPDAPAQTAAGFYGREFIEDFIDRDDPVVHLTEVPEVWQRHAGDGEPWLLVQGVPGVDAMQELMKLAEHVVVHVRGNGGTEAGVIPLVGRKEAGVTRMMARLFERGFQVDVYGGQDGDVNFPHWYVQMYAQLIEWEAPTTDVKTEYIQRCAEVISRVKEAVLAVMLPEWAGHLGLKVRQLSDVLKPYLAERKSEKKLRRERSAFEGLVKVGDEIPDYVRESREYSQMLDLYGFYPLVRTDGTPVCYMFRTEGGSYRRVADFYMEPLVHVWSQSREENKRIVRINRLPGGPSIYVEWPSSVFSKLSTLREQLINEGAFNFVGGTAADYDRVWTALSYGFQTCTRLKVFGQQPEGYFCFANGIFHQTEAGWQFDATDELGLMRHGEDVLYSPAFSKVNAGLRKDDSRDYEQDRWLAYTDVPESKRLTFGEWARLMDEVYALNDNGKWAVLYAILCAFRSDIWPIGRIFTALFFVGPTMSGKTQVAVSIRSLFIKPDAPSFNLNSGSDAAFFSVLERFRDVPQVMEEYNDEMISDVKFQGLKQVIYDGEGKQKRKAATTNDIDSSKVNAPIVLLGQESPQKDDNALSNRVILCEVPKSEAVNTEAAKRIFEQLKEAEKTGLSYLLLEVLKLRPLVQQHFADTLRTCKRELQQRVEATSARSGEQARLIETVSLFLAMCRLLEERAPHLPLPFTYETFLRLAADKVRRQIEMLVQTDKLATFFATMDYLIDQGRIIEGRDFKIETPHRLSLKGQAERTLDGERVIFLYLPNIHKMYAATSAGGERPLTMQTLQVNLRSHASFMGMVGSTRFRWTETVERPIQAETSEVAPGIIRPANPIVHRVKEQREKNTSAYVLNYDVLRQLTGVDFERRPTEDPPPPPPAKGGESRRSDSLSQSADQDLPWPMD